MTSSRRRSDRPIESVELRFSFSADRATSRKVRSAFPEAVVKGGFCHVVIKGEDPGEVAAKARDLLEKLRSLVEKPS